MVTSESTSVDNDCVVAAMMNINNIGVMNGSSSMNNTNSSVWLLMNVNKGIVVTMLHINNCVMRLSMTNNNGIVRWLCVNINNSCLLLSLNYDSVMWLYQVFSNDNSFNNWLDNRFNNHGWLDNRLSIDWLCVNWLGDNGLYNRLLFNNESVVLTLNDNFFLHLLFNDLAYVFSMNQDFTSGLHVMEHWNPLDNSKVLA